MPEVAGALQGKTQSLVRVNSEGETVVSVGVPIQRMMATRGALLLSTQGGDIDRVITSARLAQLRFFLVLAIVMLVLSLSLANTIAEPVRRLADAAERVRRGIRSRQQIPDFTARSDEIGHLSRALRDMTQALYNRLDAIESFAADVAHELKNPLTSLRSALETLPKVNAGHSRDRLIAIMQHDVRRLDRLISDISDASRLDAELARGEARPVDVAALLRAVVSMAEDSPRSNGARVKLSIPVRRGKNASADYFVLGHDSRLAQVVTNLIDNACSFSEPGGVVRVALERASARREPDGSSPSITLSSLSMMTGLESRRMRLSAFSSDFIRIGQTRDSVRIRAWACRFRAKLLKLMAVAFGPATGQLASAFATANGDNSDDNSDEVVRHGAGARFVVELPAFSA